MTHCYSAKEVYHAVTTPSGIWIDQINVTSQCWTTTDDVTGEVIERQCDTTHAQYHVGSNGDIRLSTLHLDQVRVVGSVATCLSVDEHEANGAMQYDIRTTAC